MIENNFNNLGNVLLFCIVHKPHLFNNSSHEVPVTRRNAAYCKFSIIDFSYLKQLAKIISAYSNRGVQREDSIEKSV